jgi:hypothetical protein
LIFIKGFQAPLRKLSQGDVMTLFVSENIYQRLTPFFGTLSKPSHGLITI